MIKKTISSLFIFLTFSCQSIMKKGFVVVDLVTSLDYNLSEGQPNHKTSHAVKMVSYQDVNFYITASQRTTVIEDLNKKTGEVTQREPTYDTAYTYNIIKKNAQTGLRFDSLSATKGKKFGIDSLMDIINIGKYNQKTFIKDGDKLTYSLRDKKDRLHIEKYYQHIENEPDSIYRYYDYDMRDIGFSIVPFLDEKEKSKLVRLVYITNEKIIKGVKMNREEFSFTLKRSSYGNPEKLLRLFEIFKKQSKELKIE